VKFRVSLHFNFNDADFNFVEHNIKTIGKF